MGPTLINIGFILFCLVVLNLVVREKEANLLTALRRIGLMESANLWSWFVVILLVSALSSLIAVTFGMLTKMNYFTQCEFGINFLLFFLYALSLGSLALFFGAFISSGRYMNILSFTLFAFSLVFTIVIAIFILPQLMASQPVDTFLYSATQSNFIYILLLLLIFFLDYY